MERLFQIYRFGGMTCCHISPLDHIGLSEMEYLKNINKIQTYPVKLIMILHDFPYETMILGATVHSIFRHLPENVDFFAQDPSQSSAVQVPHLMPSTPCECFWHHEGHEQEMGKLGKCR
jgi:hypothetical protein